MALTPTVLPAFPSVPQVAGVPSVARAIGRVADAVVLLTSDAKAIISLLRGPQWGIFDKAGRAVLVSDAVVAVDYRREWRIADFPVEDGGFASYDKVAEPFDVRVTFAVDGRGSLFSQLLGGNFFVSLLTGSDPAQAKRAAFLAALDALAASLTLVSVQTPEKTYTSCNIVHYDYRRESRSAVSMIIIDVWLREVRVTATRTYSQTKSPSGADAQNGGERQTAAPSTAQTTIIDQNIPT